MAAVKKPRIIEPGEVRGPWLQSHRGVREQAACCAGIRCRTGVELARLQQHGRGEPTGCLAGRGRVERALGAEAVPYRAGALADPNIDMSPGPLRPRDRRGTACTRAVSSASRGASNFML